LSKHCGFTKKVCSLFLFTQCSTNFYQSLHSLHTIYTKFVKNGGFSWGKPPVLKNVNFV
jgi:hypothetical protein